MKYKIFASVVFLLGSSLMFSQVPSDSLTGYWKDNQSLIFQYNLFNRLTKDFDIVHLTRNENADIQNNILRITEIFKKNKALKPPMGSAVYFYGEGSFQLELPSQNFPRSFSIALLERQLFKDCDTCKVYLASEADRILTLTVNELTSLLTIAPYKNDINKQPSSIYERWFIAPRLEEKFLEFPAEITEQADFIFLSKINKPFGINVTQEEYLSEAIRVAKKELIEVEKLFSSTAYETGKKELESIEADMAKAIRDIEKQNPELARTMKRDFENSKRETPAQLKGNSENIDKERNEGLNNQKWLLNELENELSTLSDKEKKSPALYREWGYAEDDSTGEKILNINIGRKDRISGLVDKGGFPIIKLNPNFFNNNLPKTAIQSVVIKIERANRKLRPNEYLNNLINRICDDLKLLEMNNLVQ